MIIQPLIIIFSLFALTRSVRQFRAGALTILWLIISLLFWTGLILVTLIPQTTSLVANVLGVGRGVDAVIYLSIIALFYLLFKLFAKIEDVEREITTLVRKLALDAEGGGEGEEGDL